VSGQNSHLRRILEWIYQFQQGNLTLTDFWKNLALIPSLLEGDVPLVVRTAIRSCGNDLELLDETASGAAAGDRAQEKIEALQLLISSHLTGSTSTTD
jgi:hypothetical protein